MKIINSELFLSLPAGIIYAYFKPVIFKGLFIKGDTIKDENNKLIDYFFKNILNEVSSNSSDEMFDIIFKREIDGMSFNLDFDCYERDGLFDNDRKYAIYEKNDIENLINVLKENIGI